MCGRFIFTGKISNTTKFGFLVLSVRYVEDIKVIPTEDFIESEEFINYNPHDLQPSSFSKFQTRFKEFTRDLSTPPFEVQNFW